MSLNYSSKMGAYSWLVLSKQQCKSARAMRMLLCNVSMIDHRSRSHYKQTQHNHNNNNYNKKYSTKINNNYNKNSNTNNKITTNNNNNNITNNKHITWTNNNNNNASINDNNNTNNNNITTTTNNNNNNNNASINDNNININHISSSNKSFEDIPKAKGLPIIGTLSDLLKAGGAEQLHTYISGRHQTLGHVFRERLGVTGEELVFVSDCAAGVQMFRSEGQYPTHVIPEPWSLYMKDNQQKRGVFFMDGKEWRENRTIMNRYLLKRGALDAHMAGYEAATDDLLSDWTAEIEGCEDVTECLIPDLERSLYKWSLEILALSLFGVRLGFLKERQPIKDLHKTDQDWRTFLDASASNQDKFVDLLSGVSQDTANFGTLPPSIAKTFNLPSWRQFNNTFSSAIDIASDYVNIGMKVCRIRELSGNPATCLLDLLLVKERLEPDIVTRVIIDLFFAAIDTTSQETKWLLYLLGNNPEVAMRARSDIQSRVANCPSKGFADIANSSSYVRAILKETLRLYPIAAFLSRRLAQDAILGGYNVPSGKMVIVSAYTMGRDAAYYSDPLTMRPERWLRDKTDSPQDSNSLRNIGEPGCPRHTPTAYMPWALGARSCVGKRLAETAMHILTAKLLLNYEVESEESVEPILKLILVPNKNLRIKIKSI